MSFYQKQGEIPHKKHTTFYQANGETLYREELMSSKGFSGIYSTLYHANPPTKVQKIDEILHRPMNQWDDNPFEYYHFLSDQKKIDGPPHISRVEYLYNDFVSIAVAQPNANSDRFYKNAGAHEMIFVHHGHGSCHTQYGSLELKEGDYLVIPRGTIYQLNFRDENDVKLLVVESSDPFEIPDNYRNEFGQLLEHAPYSERDFNGPKLTEVYTDIGDYLLDIKKGNHLFQYLLSHHPFDVVGWDGYLYPFTFSIDDFAPIVGKIHQPPPVHTVFSTPHFVLCNFVPRLLDFHPQAIPAPYFHSNVDCDEVLYYVSGNFTSRKGIKESSITLHPMGIPHGPQPGKTEASVGKKETDEVAVMIDTFESLKLTNNVKETMVREYYKSWID